MDSGDVLAGAGTGVCLWWLTLVVVVVRVLDCLYVDVVVDTLRESQVTGCEHETKCRSRKK